MARTTGWGLASLADIAETIRIRGQGLNPKRRGFAVGCGPCLASLARRRIRFPHDRGTGSVRADHGGA
ncbi:hypothetical protein SY2F82_33240 [Streptomyces sp. Y2F8-2]|nr:hypothetical protein SY2F82_33240 [Streptomyces sp. Y2F8-2]